MKKKLTVNTLAMGNLKQRKKQYTILIIGIILAMVFSSGIMFFLSCMQSSTEETNRRFYGTQDEIYLKATDIDFENDPLSEFISDYSFAHTIGFAIKDEEKSDIGTAVAYLDEKAVDMYYPYLYEGRLPEADGEIAVERQALMQLGFENIKLGEQITLTMKIPDGKEFSDKIEKRTFSLVGVICNKKSHVCEWDSADEANFLPAAFVNRGEKVALGGKELLVAFVNLKKYEKNYNEENWDWDKYYDASEKVARISTRSHDETDGTSGTDIRMTMIYSIAFAIILTLVSCLAIVNAFANNLRERKRQIGMLRAVGATKRQITKIYAREAFIISLISAPISILISYFGVKLITGIMGDDLIFIPKIWILFVGALLGVICVMCAAVIPLIPISRSSPMQAIRNVDYVRKLRRKKIHSQKSFDVSSLLAKRNITLTRSRQIIVSIILAITIIFSCFGFSAMMHEKAEADYNGYEYELGGGPNSGRSFVNLTLDSRGYSDNDIAELRASGYFSEIMATKSGTINIMLDKFTDYQKLIAMCNEFNEGSVYENVEEGITAKNYKEKATKISPSFSKFQKKYDYNSLLLSVQFASIGSEYFSKIKEDEIEGEINLEKLKSGEEIVLIAPPKIAAYIETIENFNYSFLVGRKFKETDYLNENMELVETQERSFKAGDELNLSVICTTLKNSKDFVRTDRKVKIGAILDSAPNGFGWELSSIYGLGILTTNEASHLFSPEIDYSTIMMNTKNTLDDETDKIISPYLENISLSVPDGRFRNNYEFAKENEQSIRIILFGMICIIGLFLAICGCVVNNALTARIREGKREIGTLRAVGADLKILSSSYIKQLLSVFGWGNGLGFGLYTVGYVLFAVMNKAMKWGKELFEFRILETILMCGVLFLICSLNLYIKIKQEMRHSIVENIREL